MKPNFLVIGAMKSATTSLCALLAAHPQVYLSDPKEPEYFCKDEIYGRGPAWYESLFEGARGRRAIGEGSTSYTKSAIFPHAATRIARDLPQARLIYIVRHPLRRIESHWLHLIAIGLETPSFAEAVRSLPQLVDTSHYWKQIGLYRERFPDERILVMFFEDFERAPQESLDRCHAFLGVDPRVVPDAAVPALASRDARVDGVALTWLRRSAVARRIKDAFPGAARAAMQGLRRPLPGRPVWPARLRGEVVARIAPDAAQFLAFYGKPPDYWDLS